MSPHGGTVEYPGSHAGQSVKKKYTYGLRELFKHAHQDFDGQEYANVQREQDSKGVNETSPRGVQNPKSEKGQTL
jgi:hypothetical protein